MIWNTLEDNLTSLKIRREKKSMMMMLSSICLSVVISLLTFIPSTFSRDIVLLQGANFELVRIMNTPVFCRILKSNLLFIGSYHLQVYCYSLLWWKRWWIKVRSSMECCLWCCRCYGLTIRGGNGEGTLLHITTLLVLKYEIFICMI